MSAFEKLLFAKSVISKLEKNINPINDLPGFNDVFIDNSIIESMSYLLTIIEKEIASFNNKSFLPAIDIIEGKLNDFCYSSTPVTVTEICKRLNMLYDINVYKKVTSCMITGYLIKCGYLYTVVKKDGISKNMPTEMGFDAGLLLKRQFDEKTQTYYDLVLYDLKMQKFIIARLKDIFDLQYKI